MSIESMKLAEEFNRYFTSANGVDVPAKVSVSRDEWRALFTAIQQAEAQQPATQHPRGCGFCDHELYAATKCPVCGRETQPATGEPVANDGWLQDRGLLYRLTDEKNPRNRDEIKVMMADSSRSDASCTRRAGELLDRIRANHPAPSVPADVVRDAERYRWLKEKGAYEPPRFNDADGYGEFQVFFWTHSKTLDAAIDAAMLAAKDSK